MKWEYYKTVPLDPNHNSSEAYGDGEDDDDYYVPNKNKVVDDQDDDYDDYADFGFGENEI